MSGRWLECCLSEPRDMVQTVAPQALTKFKGEHLLAAAQNSLPRNGDAFSSTEVVGIPAGAIGWSLNPPMGEWMDATFSPLRARVLTEVLR